MLSYCTCARQLDMCIRGNFSSSSPLLLTCSLHEFAVETCGHDVDPLSCVPFGLTFLAPGRGTSANGPSLA